MKPLAALTEAPLISIVMTAHNAEAFLAEALQSVLAQATARTWELLFVDDGSTDETRAIVEEYTPAFVGRLRVLQHPGGVNRGISASRNLALAHAQGALLTFLDADDVWLPCCLEAQASLLHRHPEVDMVYAEAERWVHFDRAFDEEAARAGWWGSNFLPPLLPHNILPGLLPPGALTEWFRADESLVPCICAVMVRTAVAREVGGFCDSFTGLYDDQVFHARLVRQHTVYAQRIPVARYRQHASSCCAQARMDATAAAHERERFSGLLEEMRP